MRNISILVIITIICLSCNRKTNSDNLWPTASAPIAEVKPHIRTIHADTVIDNYYWMIDYFKKGPDSTKIVDYLTQENNYLKEMMSSTNSLQNDLFNEMKARIKEVDQSAPYFLNGYYYYQKTEKGKEYFKLCRKKGSLDAPEEVLIDVDEIAKGYAYFKVSHFSVSPNNKYLAYGVDQVSRYQFNIYVKDLETGEIINDAIENTNGKAVWANDNKTFFYTSNNPITLLSEKIKKHTLGTPAKSDISVYNEQDNTNYIHLEKSKDNKFIFINSAGTLSSETRFIDANSPNDSFKIFSPRIKNVLYSVISKNDKFLILTNWNAENFKLMESTQLNTSSNNWKEFIPNRPDVLIETVDAFNNFIVINERKNGLNELRIIKDNDDDFYIKQTEPTFTLEMSMNPEFNTNKIRYSYSSLTTPNTVYNYDIINRKNEIVKQQMVVGSYKPENYVSERLFATAIDGTKIPISIVYKKGFNKDGKAPLLLYAYGSYGNSTDATFSSIRLSLLDRGFAYAIAHIRGGQEMGRKWYEDGKLLKKKNSFTDFIDAGQFLVDQKYTSPKHMYANGLSAGGLLMGAIATMKPELWNGVIAEVPFVDVVNTMLDVSIPLTTNEFDEWGNPMSLDYYNYQKSYSPYENVMPINYPNLLVTIALHDSQVQYFEPAKWVAKLRANKKGDNVVLLNTNMDYGHSGASGRFDYLKDEALNFAFILKLEGISK